MHKGRAGNTIQFIVILKEIQEHTELPSVPPLGTPALEVLSVILEMPRVLGELGTLGEWFWPWHKTSPLYRSLLLICRGGEGQVWAEVTPICSGHLDFFSGPLWLYCPCWDKSRSGSRGRWMLLDWAEAFSQRSLLM